MRALATLVITFLSMLFLFVAPGISFVGLLAALYLGKGINAVDESRFMGWLFVLGAIGFITALIL